MSQEKIKVELSRKALNICNQRIQSQSIHAPGILDSIRTQLEWLIDFFNGKRNNERNKLQEIIVGHYAIHELDERDLELVHALTKVQYVVSQTVRGLKLDMKVLDNAS